jgi:hypothetical protein
MNISKKSRNGLITAFTWLVLFALTLGAAFVCVQKLPMMLDIFQGVIRQGLTELVRLPNP